MAKREIFSSQSCNFIVALSPSTEAQVLSHVRIFLLILPTDHLLVKRSVCLTSYQTVIGSKFGIYFHSLVN